MYLPIYELLCDLPMKSWVEDVISWVLTWSDPVQFYDTTVVRDWSSVVVNYSNSHGLSRIAEIDWWEGEREAEDPPQVDTIAKEDLFIKRYLPIDWSNPTEGGRKLINCVPFFRVDCVVDECGKVFSTEAILLPSSWRFYRPFSDALIEWCFWFLCYATTGSRFNWISVGDDVLLSPWPGEI